jgi:hypothetical protein
MDDDLPPDEEQTRAASRFKRRVRGCCFLIGGFCLLYLVCSLNVRFEVGDLQRRAKQDLPAGTPRPTVEAWLRARGLPFEAGVDPDGRTMVSGSADVFRLEVGSRSTVYVRFSFDEQDRLKDSSIDWSTQNLMP